ncbi:MAG: type I polyketide synthase, partial [Pseudomonadota bacterium]
ASDARFGFECSGRITAVGEGVKDLEIGDEVLAGLTVEGSLGTYVTVDASGVVKKPVGMSHEEGATIPLAFLTACYGLERLAELQKGESVLIHAAAGGVGLAAIQIAQRAGARIYATASPGKWEYLKSLGVEAVMNSRTLEYAKEIMALTGGKGVDVVLNSLTGEFIPKNLDILAQGGRFIEIGKIGIWDGEKVRRQRPDIRYHPFDLGEVAREDPGLLGEMLAELMKGFEQGDLKPLKRTVFGIEESANAFRYMAQAKHIGKVVLTGEAKGVRIRPDATYLITGGLGALGCLIAEHLKHQGAGTIVLCGRNPAGPAIADRMERLQGNGTNVVVMLGDISREEEAADILERIRATLPELKGIVHAAGILDDGIIRDQTWERFIRVMSPKIDGVWNLYRHLQDRHLDFFILFSSTASGLGSPGQSNYAAANAFLDAMSHDLRQRGCPATTINWGPWDGIGMAASHKEAGARYARQGVRPIRPADGIDIFDRILACDPVQVYAVDIDWITYTKRISAGRPKYEMAGFLVELLKGAAAEAGKVGKKPAIRQKLKEATGEKRIAILRFAVIDAARKVMGYGDVGRIRTDQPLMEQGLDSLMSVELRNLLSEGLDISLPVGLLFNYPSVNDLCRYLAELLKIDPENASGGRDGSAAGKNEDEFAYIDEMDPDELEAMIKKELQ